MVVQLTALRVPTAVRALGTKQLQRQLCCEQPAYGQWVLCISGLDSQATTAGSAAASAADGFKLNSTPVTGG